MRYTGLSADKCHPCQLRTEVMSRGVEVRYPDNDFDSGPSRIEIQGVVHAVGHVGFCWETTAKKTLEAFEST